MIESLKKHFKIRDMRNDHPPFLVTPPEKDAGRVALAHILADMGAKRGVEVGTYKGVSAKIWLTECPGLHLTCVDPWLGSRAGAYDNAMSRLAGLDVEVMKFTSMAAVELFTDGSLDFVHIDGNHTYDHVAPDIIFWSRKLRPGGLMVCHDYIEFHGAGVIDAVRAYTHCHHIDPWFVARETLPSAFWWKP